MKQKTERKIMKTAARCVLEYYENGYCDIERGEIRAANRRLAIYDGREYWVGKREPIKRAEKGGPYAMRPVVLAVYRDGNCLWRI